MKRKTMTLVLCLLAALALVSVGFASWVISVDANKEVSGNIKVENVVDSRLEATITPSAPSIVFGTPTDTIANPWLTNTSIGTQVLEVKFTIVVTEGGMPYEGKTGKITASYTEGVVTYDGTTNQITPVAGGTEGNYAKAVKATYVTAMNLTEVTETATKGTYEVTFSVGWGAAFGSTNPYTYYNALKAEDEAENAKKALNGMYDLLQNCGFIITIKVTH